MQVHGVGVGRGIAVGPILRMPEPLPEPADVPSAIGAPAETERAVGALAAVSALLRRRGERVGGTAKDMLDAQALMAEDPALDDEVTRGIRAGKTAERAVFEALAVFRRQLADLGGYLGERAGDLDDLAQRAIAQLTGLPAPGVGEREHPFVLLAPELGPADIALLDPDKTVALIMSGGGPTSHAAILAREKSIVAVVGAAGARDLPDGTVVIVDAAAGMITVDPSPRQRERAHAAIAARAEQTPVGVGAGALADGTPIQLLANLGSVGDAEEAIALGAEGVGLFRTELLFLGAAKAPTIAEQREHYTRLLDAFAGRKVVVRVFDAGADKPLAFLNTASERNPALGLRGLRALRANERLLRDQLAALANADAATDAELWVMAPMVSTVEETRYFTRIVREAGLRTAGVMVEVPSSALLADRILAEADFASIGTNDLVQYTLAADRLLGSLAAFQDPWDPAVLRLVAEVGRAGAALGKPIGVCGEAAADPLLAVVLVGLGATSLSMSPAALSGVRAELRRFTLAQAGEFAKLALSENGAGESRAAVFAASSKQSGR